MGYVGTKPTAAPLTSAQLEDGLVTATKLATDAVETAKVKDLNVTAGKLAATQNLSTKTITLPATVAGLGTGIDAATQLANKVPAANLGTGTASASTFLRGDQTYAAPSVSDIAWQAVTTGTTLTAVAGRGYPINTTSNVCTVTLPVSASVGDQIIFTDYARTWSSYAVTLDQGSLKYQGYDDPNPAYDTDGESVHIVYMDATQGWVPINDGAVALETPQSYSIEFLVVAGGASGGCWGGGGGAGGYRTSTQSIASGTAITVTIGDGGPSTTSSAGTGSDGDDSSISGSGVITITSAGGGAGGGNQVAGNDGGSGGGGGNDNGIHLQAGGSGNIPITDPSQGEDGGAGGYGAPGYPAGGGGGAGAVGADSVSNTVAGAGGNGTASSISGSSETYAGGGGGNPQSGTSGAGGTGGGGAGNTGGAATAGTVNTGGGGGGAKSGSASGAGGKGVIVISVPDADYSGTTTGSPTVATGQAGSKTTMVFTGDGSYTA